jgi:RNA polymerase sigma factor (sigma-70 family)
MRSNLPPHRGRLSQPAEKRLFQLVVSTGSSEAFSALVSHQFPIARAAIRHVRHRFTVPNTLVDDALGEAPEWILDVNVEYWRAREAGSTCRLSTFLVQGVEGDFLNLIRKHTRHQAHHDPAIRAHPECEAELGRHARPTGLAILDGLWAEDHCKGVEDRDLIEAAKRFLSTLTAEEQALGSTCMLSLTPVSEFAEQTGIPVSTVKRDLTKLRAKLRRRFPEAVL